MGKETEITAETLLALEEAEHLLRQLTVLTERGRITWHCTHYNPLDLMPDIQEGKPETAVLIHIVKAEGEYNGQCYESEIVEQLTIPGSKGSIDVDLKVTRSGKRLASYVWGRFSTEAQVRFADAVMPRLEGGEAVELGFDQARYSTAYTPDYIAAHPLTELGQRLCRERRLLDFHRIVTESEYREKLLQNRDCLFPPDTL